MIIEQKQASVTSNMQGAEYRAGVDDEDMGHIIGLFTDLYSDQELAVIREYSTNAIDAQIEAGVSRPIEVSLPGGLSPYFKVRDFGIGLDAESIRRIYSRYGRSTKRSTNDQNGALGLGCKSALTYSDQFTIESNKDGTKTICIVTREEGGVPVFQVLGEQPTTEANGTTVIVPVRRSNDFTTKAAEHFGTIDWIGKVRVDGQAPTPLVGLDIGNGMLVQKHDYYERKPHRVVMSGVTYPIQPGTFDPGLPSGYSVIMAVPNGSVNFTPSREALMYTSTTRATLDGLVGNVKAGIRTAVQAEIDKTTSVRQAINVVTEWRGLLGNQLPAGTFVFNGKGAMPDVLTARGEFVEKNSRKVGKSQWLNQLSLDYVPATLFFAGWNIDTFTPTHKRKLLQYCKSRNLDAKYYMLVNDKTSVDSTWVEDSQWHDWADVKAEKLPKMGVVTQSGRPTGSYDAFLPGEKWYKHVQADELDTSQRIFFAEGMNRYECEHYVRALREFFPMMTLVALPQNRVAKFKRNFPSAVSYGDAFREAYNAWQAKLTPEQIEALRLHDSGVADSIRKLDPAKVDDPAIKAAIRRVQQTLVRDLVRERNTFQSLLYVGKQIPDDWTNPISDYMLFDHIDLNYLSNPADVEQFYLGINAAYNARP